jgi:hypothetical protein
VGEFAISEAWLRFVLSLRPVHRQQLVTRTGAPLWDGRQSLAGKRVLLFAPKTFPDVPASADTEVAGRPAFSRVRGSVGLPALAATALGYCISRVVFGVRRTPLWPMKSACRSRLNSDPRA